MTNLALDTDTPTATLDEATAAAALAALWVPRFLQTSDPAHAVGLLEWLAYPEAAQLDRADLQAVADRVGLFLRARPTGGQRGPDAQRASDDWVTARLRHWQRELSARLPESSPA
jgi:hypothetical protein